MQIDKSLSSLLQNTGDMALKRRARNIIRELNLKKNDRVLDIGCGDGYYLHLLKNIGIKLDLAGVDNDDEGLKKAQKNLNGSVPLYKGDLMEKIPFRANTFDKIVMSEVVEHLPDDVRGLKEARRVLKKGGTLVLSVPNHNYPFFWDPVNYLLEKMSLGPIRSGFFAGIWNQHERLYTPEEIKKKVKKSGFKVENVKSLTWWCIPFNHYVVNIVARILAHGGLTKESTEALSKYTKKPKRPWYLDFAFGGVNLVDKLNDIWQPRNHGVSVLIKATKNED